VDSISVIAARVPVPDCYGVGRGSFASYQNACFIWLAHAAFVLDIG
jgi:hypothetical protein